MVWISSYRAITPTIDVDSAYTRAAFLGGEFRVSAVNTRAKITGSTANTSDIINGIWVNWTDLRASYTTMDTTLRSPSFERYARSQLDDQLYDTIANLDAMLAAVDAVIAWIVTDGNGFFDNRGVEVAGLRMIVGGRYVGKVFTNLETEALGLLLDDVIALIAA